MKNPKHIILLLLVFITVFNSCMKIDPIVEPDSVTEIASVKDLNVPASFDWKTSQTLNISVTLPSNGVVQPLIITI